MGMVWVCVLLLWVKLILRGIVFFMLNMRGSLGGFVVRSCCLLV